MVNPWLRWHACLWGLAACTLPSEEGEAAGPAEPPKGASAR